VRPVTVVLVDDSQTVRAVLRRMLTQADGIEVIGEAEDGQDGVDLTLQLEPDVVVMDLDLPTMDGFTASALITEKKPTPIVVVTSKGGPEQIATVFESMKTGVVGLLPKPEVPEGWSKLSRDLEETIRQVGSHRAGVDAHPCTAPAMGAARCCPTLIAVGASTGGPGALCDLLREIGANSRVAIAVVQHIAEGFDVGLCEWLARELRIDVGPAIDGRRLAPGTVRIAPPGAHLRIGRDGVQRLDHDTPPVRGHRPSANILFESMLGHRSHSAAAVLLTGMGNDGAEAMLALRNAGVLTIAQDEATSAVFGMPRAAIEIGAAELVMSPPEIGRLLSTLLSGAP